MKMEIIDRGYTEYVSASMTDDAACNDVCSLTSVLSLSVSRSGSLHTPRPRNGRVDLTTKSSS